MILVTLVMKLLLAFIPCVYLKQLYDLLQNLPHVSSVDWWRSSMEMSQLIIHKSQHNSENKRLFSTYGPLAAVWHQIISAVGDRYNKDQWR